jgi:hypothetical protein
MAYKVIRASSGYETIVVELEEKGVKRYFVKDNLKPTEDFEEVSEESILMYFSGIADQMGFGELPEQTFDSLEEVDEWREKAQRAAAENHLTETLAWLDKKTKEEESERRKEELKSLRKECLEALQELRENKG